MVCLLSLRGDMFRRQLYIIGSRSDIFPSGEDIVNLAASRLADQGQGKVPA